MHLRPGAPDYSPLRVIFIAKRVRILLTAGDELVIIITEERLRKVKRAMKENILKVKNRYEFRLWLESNASTESECFIIVKRGRPVSEDVFYYLDAVEEALCFGWIDSTLSPVDGVMMQRFTPRRNNSSWSELNKERVRRLEKLGLMTDAGRAVLPPMGPRSFRIDPDIDAALRKARCCSKFKAFPGLYQRVRAGNIASYKKQNPSAYEKMLAHLTEETKKGRMYGEWNDYGRLLDY